MAKTIYLLGKFNFYSSNYEIFIEKVASLFKCNIYYSIDKYSFYKGEEMSGSFFKDFGYKKEASVFVSYLPLDEKNPNIENSYIVYDLEISVEYKYELSYTFVFNPNGFFYVISIPFNTAWDFFVEDLSGMSLHYYNFSYKEMAKSILLKRDTYINLLKIIDCKKVIIFSDHLGGFLDEFGYPPLNQNKSFDEMLDFIVDKYSVKPLQLMDILEQRIKISLSNNYHWSEAYQYIFIDEVL